MNKLTRILLCTLATLSFALPAADDDKKSLLGPGGTQRTPKTMEVAKADAQVSTCRASCTMTDGISTHINFLCKSASNPTSCFDKVCKAHCNWPPVIADCAAMRTESAPLGIVLREQADALFRVEIRLDTFFANDVERSANLPVTYV